MDAAQLEAYINEQKAKVKLLMSELNSEVESLMHLKSQKKCAATDDSTQGSEKNDSENEIQSDSDSEIESLVNLKSKYESATSEDLTYNGDETTQEDTDTQSIDTQQSYQPVKYKRTKSRLEVEEKKEDQLLKWYLDVLIKSEMIKYYDASGCYVLRPFAFTIWEAISKWFDGKIKKMGFHNSYFSIFLSHKSLQKELKTLQNTQPEIACMAQIGKEELAYCIARQTSMYPVYANWVHTHLELPVKVNQWFNVVRCESKKNLPPFLRSGEFLWQQGHSAYATYQEAEEELYQVLKLYEEIYEGLLAIPIIKGKRTQKETFDSNGHITTLEIYISAAGRGIQGATCHHLGQNLSRAASTSSQDDNNEETHHAYQNTWTLTAQSIGILVLVHADNKGLVLPPKVANVQVIIIPCGNTTDLSDGEEVNLYEWCETIQKKLRPHRIRTKIDYRATYSEDWKSGYWELKGVPLHIKLSSYDIRNGQLVAVRRDTSETITVKIKNVAKSITNLLDKIQSSMFQNAKSDLDQQVSTCYNMQEFHHFLDKNCLILAPSCGKSSCEEDITKLTSGNPTLEEESLDMGAKALCIPLEQPKDITEDMKCIHEGCSHKPKHYTLFGRSF